MDIRKNPDLDEAFAGNNGESVNRPAKGQRRKPRAHGKRDVIRRLSDLGPEARLAVLKAAERLNRS